MSFGSVEPCERRARKSSTINRAGALAHLRTRAAAALSISSLNKAHSTSIDAGAAPPRSGQHRASSAVRDYRGINILNPVRRNFEDPTRARPRERDEVATAPHRLRRCSARCATSCRLRVARPPLGRPHERQTALRTAHWRHAARAHELDRVTTRQPRACRHASTRASSDHRYHDAKGQPPPT